MLDLRLVTEAGFDFYPARFHRFRHLSYQVDLQEPVLEICAGYFDIVGEVELASERAPGNALMEILAIILLGLAAFDPGMKQTSPKSGDSMPVIPPSGTPGGNPSVKPT